MASPAWLVCLLFAGAALTSAESHSHTEAEREGESGGVQLSLRGAGGAFQSDASRFAHADLEAQDPRRLIVEVHFCESTFNLLDPNNIHPIWTEPSWLEEGAFIFLAVYLGITAVLILLAWVLDCRTTPVLQRVQEARREANVVHHGEGGVLKRSLVERYGTRTELVSEILDQIQEKQEEEQIMKMNAQLRLLLKPDADEARKQAIAKILARFCASFSLRFYLAGLEPAAFRYIRSEELLNEGQAAVQEFLLLPQWQQARIAIIGSNRLAAGFFADYAIPRTARVAAALVQTVASAATACLISSHMGWKLGRNESQTPSERCHPTDPLQRYLREFLLAFGTFLIQELVHYVIVGIRHERFLRPGWNKAALACCLFVRKRVFWFCMHLWFFLSLFFIVQFLATSSTLDGHHWIFVTSMILAIGLVLKPLVAACFVMTIYVLANYLGMALVSDEIHNCLRPKHADELTKEDLEQLDRKFLGQLLTSQGDAADETSKKKKKKKKRRGEVEESNNVDNEDSDEGVVQLAITNKETEAHELEPTMLDEVIEADMKAAEEQAKEKPAQERPLKSAAKAGKRTSVASSHERRMSAVSAVSAAERTGAAAKAERGNAGVEDPEIGEDLEEFESWTPLHSEKSFEQDTEPRKAAITARVSRPDASLPPDASSRPLQELQPSPAKKTSVVLPGPLI